MKLHQDTLFLEIRSVLYRWLESKLQNKIESYYLSNFCKKKKNPKKMGKQFTKVLLYGFNAVLLVSWKYLLHKFGNYLPIWWVELKLKVLWRLDTKT